VTVGGADGTDGRDEARPATPPVAARLHRAALIEDRVHAVLDRRLRRRGWRINIVPFTGYGAPGWVRVMARVLLSRPGPRRSRRPAAVRGWRSFLTLPVKDTPVTIEVAGRKHEVSTDRAGYVDCVVNGTLSPGWTKVRLSLDDTEPVEAMVRVVDPAVRFGVVSDVDDTVMVTMLPRPLLAAWHTFVLDEHARMAVPGMAVLYERLTNAHPGAPVFYLCPQARGTSHLRSTVSWPGTCTQPVHYCSPTGDPPMSGGFAAGAITSRRPSSGWPKNSRTFDGCSSVTTANTTGRSTGSSPPRTPIMSSP